MLYRIQITELSHYLLSSNVFNDFDNLNRFANVFIFIRKESTATSKPEYTYNRVFVYDKEWFPVVDKIKNRMENILIRGELHYTGCKLPSGQNVASGIIVAHQIYKKY